MGKLNIPWLNRKAGKKRAGSAAAALAAGLVLLTILIGAAIGRYQTRLKSEASVTAKEFYFTSEFLDDGIHNLAPGSTQVKFTLGNHADQLRISEVDISYEVKVESADSTKTPGVEYGNADKKLGKDVAKDDTVTITNLESGKTYKVTATGKGGYEKSLTATVRVLSDEAQIYKHQENFAEYTRLTVWNEGAKEGTVKIGYVGIPDNTNPNMTDWQTGTAAAPITKEGISIPAHSSMVFRFFDSGTITVEKADGEAVTAKVPN